MTENVFALQFLPFKHVLPVKKIADTIKKLDIKVFDILVSTKIDKF